MTLLTRLGRDLPESATCALAKSPPSVDVVLRLGLSILSRVVNAVVPYFRWTQYRCSAPTKQNVSIVRCHWNGHPCGGSPCSWLCCTFGWLFRSVTKACETYYPHPVNVAPVRSASSVAGPREFLADPAPNMAWPKLGGSSATTSPPPATAACASVLLNPPLPLPLPPSPPPLASTLSGPSVNPPKLDLDQLRRQARDVARDGADSRALLPLPMMAKEAQKQDMEKLFDKALKRPDCKEVYSDLGLLVVVPLLRDAAKGSGCKW